MATSNVALNDALANVKKNSQTAVYKRLLEAVNPYSAYNNTDRALNLVYRYYTVAGLETLYKKSSVNMASHKDQLEYLYEAQTNQMSQYYWASTAIKGVGYSINRTQFGLEDVGDRLLAGLMLVRSIINAVDETMLAIANDVRWSARRFGRAPYTPAGAMGRFDSGMDTVDYSASTVGIIGGLFVGAFSRLSNGAQIGWDSVIGIESVIGTSFNDRIEGNDKANALLGGSGDDQLSGQESNDWLNGGDGNDTLNGGVDDDQLLGGNQDDWLDGGSGKDWLYGESGNDTLGGNDGDDHVIGGAGSDIYVYGRFEGVDVLEENDTTAGSTDVDVLQFNAGWSYEIWLRRVSNDLEVSRIGSTNEKVLISNWYLGSQYHVEQIKCAEYGKTLLDTDVDKLVNAMAAFGTPSSATTTIYALPDGAPKTALMNALAANWH